MRDGDSRIAGGDHDPDARDDDLEALADGIPNNDEPWAEYRSIGLAFFAASDGSAAGLNAYDRWARKSAKYDGRTADEWEHFRRSPPNRTGTGALVKRARRANPELSPAELGVRNGQQEAETEQPSTGLGASDWPVPDMAVVAAHRSPPPDLPIEVFGPFWGSWISAAAAAKSAPPDFIAAALFPAVGALLVSKRRGSPWAGWSEPAVLWVSDIGPPSSGKSPAIDAVADPMSKIEVELNEDFADRRRQWKTDKLEAETRRAQWEAEAKEAVKKGHKPPLMPFDCEEPDPPHERRLIINDVTPEKLVRLAAANPFGLLHQRDEWPGGWAGWIATAVPAASAHYGWKRLGPGPSSSIG